MLSTSGVLLAAPPTAWHWQSPVSDLPIKPLAQGSGCRGPVDIHLEGEGAQTSAAPLWLLSPLSFLDHGGSLRNGAGLLGIVFEVICLFQ